MGTDLEDIRNRPGHLKRKASKIVCSNYLLNEWNRYCNATLGPYKEILNPKILISMKLRLNEMLEYICKELFISFKGWNQPLS